MTGAAGREAATIGRALDLGTQELGVTYLGTQGAEVLIRRLVSTALAHKLGSYRLSEILEEVPGDGALAELPDMVLKDMSERLKLEMKLEQLMQTHQK